MSFESVRGYIQLASGLGEVTRARAMEAAQGLLSLPGVGITTGKLAVQASALAEELLAAATTNREHLRTLVRAEVDAAVTRLGLVAADKLKESQAEAARLRVEVATLRSASAPPARKSAKKAAAKTTAPKKSAVKKSAVKRSAVKKSSASRASARPTASSKAASSKATADRARSAVTTRRKPAGT